MRKALDTSTSSVITQGRLFSNPTGQKDFTQDSEFKKIKEYFAFTDLHDYAKDFGSIVSKMPLAVFMPPTVEILQQFLKIASQYAVKITCRGKGSSVYGQSQVKDGVVIDLKNLEVSFEYVSSDFSEISVPAFKTWFDVTEHTKQQNKTIPVATDNLDLTVGGTLSFGAIGGTSYRCGSGADNVISLDVLTLDGRRHTCSKTENRELFDAVLCGQGQFGIIIRANIPLVEAKKQVNLYLLSYKESGQFLREQKALYEAAVFDHLKGYARKKEGDWEYVIEAATYYDEHESKRVSEELLKLKPVEQVTQTMPYWEFINLVTNFIKSLREAKKLNVPLPWYNVFVPEDEIEKHLAEVLNSPHVTGSEPNIVYPMNSDFFQKPFFIRPKSKIFYLVGALYNTSFDSKIDFPHNEVLESNYALYLAAKERGVCRYPVDAIPFSPEDWSKHYGEHWETFCALKEKYDPLCLLSTGANIFEPITQALLRSEVIGQQGLKN